MKASLGTLLNASIVAAACMMFGCKSPEVAPTTDASGMAEVKHSGMDNVQIDPGTDFSKYQSIQLDVLGVDQIKVIEPDENSLRYRSFTLNDEDKALLRTLYLDGVKKALTAKGGYTVVASDAAATPATLKLVSEVIEISPNAPREQDMIDPTVRSTVVSKGAGSMKMQGKLVDAQTGKVVLTMHDKIQDMDTWQRNNSITNRMAIERAFSQWGYSVKRLLESTKISKPAAAN